MPRTSSGILLLKKEESPIFCNNSHTSISTQEQTYQTHSRQHNQAVTRAICLQNTLHLRIILKLQKQSCLCSLSANSHFPRYSQMLRLARVATDFLFYPKERLKSTAKTF